MIQSGPLVVSSLVLVFLSGCSRNDSPAPVKGPEKVATDKTVQVEKSVFASRLDAAKGIGNVNHRDEACSKLAIDAATSGDDEVTKGAVLLIGNSVIHDDTAYMAALKLAKAGKGEGANTLVRLIGNSNLQDEARAKIAKGDVGP